MFEPNMALLAVETLKFRSDVNAVVCAVKHGIQILSKDICPVRSKAW
jgi:hypothetical protein